jgi:hypothetical protein
MYNEGVWNDFSEGSEVKLWVEVVENGRTTKAVGERTGCRTRMVVKGNGRDGKGKL